MKAAAPELLQGGRVAIGAAQEWGVMDGHRRAVVQGVTHAVRHGWGSSMGRATSIPFESCKTKSSGRSVAVRCCQDVGRACVPAEAEVTRLPPSSFVCVAGAWMPKAGKPALVHEFEASCCCPGWISALRCWLEIIAPPWPPVRSSKVQALNQA